MILSADNFSMAPEIDVGLEGDIPVDFNADLDSVKQESDTDILPLSAMAALEAVVTIEEISELLPEISSGKPRDSAALERATNWDFCFMNKAFQMTTFSPSANSNPGSICISIPIPKNTMHPIIANITTTNMPIHVTS